MNWEVFLDFWVALATVIGVGFGMVYVFDWLERKIGANLAAATMVLGFGLVLSIFLGMVM